MKKTYQSPEFDVFQSNAEDVITTSSEFIPNSESSGNSENYEL